MRKMLFAFLLFLLVFSIHTETFADIHEDIESPNVSGYTWYDVEGLKFLIPDDFLTYSPEVSEDGDFIVFASNKASLSLIYYSDFDEPLTELNAILHFKNGLRGAASSFDDVYPESTPIEQINYRGYPSYLATFRLSKLPYMLKVCSFLDTTKQCLYSAILTYDASQDGTKITDDFYKMLSSKPEDFSESSAFDTDKYYDGLHNYVDSLEQVSSSLNKAFGASDEEQKELEEYYGALHDYVDAMESLYHAWD